MSQLLYHWSPMERRKGIKRYGLVPGKWSPDRIWRPPMICLAASPSLAWALSAEIHGDKHDIWDLWMVWDTSFEGYEIIPYDDGTPREYRVYHRIYKRDLWYVGSRSYSEKI